MRIIFLKRNNFLGKQNVRYDAKTRMKLYVILLYSELVLTSLKERFTCAGMCTRKPSVRRVRYIG